MVATAVTYDFVRGRNDAIEKEPMENNYETTLPAMNSLAVTLGNSGYRYTTLPKFCICKQQQLIFISNVIHVYIVHYEPAYCTYKDTTKLRQVMV